MDNSAYENELEEKTIPIVKDANTRPIDKDLRAYSFEEAVALTGTGKYHYFLQVISGICLMVANIEIMFISMIMPFINRDISSTIAEQGFFVSASYLGIVFSSHAVGFLCDTWGRVKMLRSTLSLSCITSVISAFSVNIWMLIGFRFLNGIILSACQSCIYSFVGEFHSKQNRARYITMFSMFIPLGLVIMPALAIVILPLKLNAQVFGMNFGSWRLLIISCVALRIIAIIGLFILPESPKFVLIQGDHAQALKTLRKMFSINSGKPACDYPVQKVFVEGSGGKLYNVSGVKDTINLIWKQTSPLFCKHRVLHTLNFSLILFILCWIAQGTLMWFPTLLIESTAKAGSGYTTCEIMELTKNVSENINSAQNISRQENIAIVEPDNDPADFTMLWILMAIGAVFSVSYFIFSLIIDKIGKRNLLFVWILVAASSCLIFVYATNSILSVVLLALIASMNSCIGIISTVAMEFFPTNVNAMGMCLIMMIARIGAVAGSNVFVLMLYEYCDTLFYIYFALCILIAVLSLFLP